MPSNVKTNAPNYLAAIMARISPVRDNTHVTCRLLTALFYVQVVYVKVNAGCQKQRPKNPSLAMYHVLASSVRL
jgi:hypothetical protein